MLAELSAGDEVKWTDSDGGLCSRVLKIRSIKITDDIFVIQDEDGSVVGGFVNELS